MVYSIILFLCILLFVGVHELLRRTAIRNIKESDNADELAIIEKSSLDYDLLLLSYLDALLYM